MEPLHRVHPFDTGAFEKGLYCSGIHPNLKISDFELNANCRSISEAVERFFGDNKSYYQGNVKRGINLTALDIEAEAFVSIASTPCRTAADDRRSAIEVQINRAIDITKMPVLAVIVPEQLLDERSIETFIVGTLGAEPIGYYCPHARPAEDVRAIMIEAKRFYKARGIIP